MREVTRDISYAPAAKTRGGRALIRVIENTTGRIGLIKRAKGYEQDVNAGHNFWDVMVDRYGLSLDVVGGSLSNIPAKGPLLLVSNHPYGILDGLMMGKILNDVRGDFRILANQVFAKAENLNRNILPICFDQTKRAVQKNIQTRKHALTYLGQGGAIGIFPGGTVSTACHPFGMPLDPGWRNFTARMILKSEAQVVPMFFDGHTSRMFQIASHMHNTLRLGLLINEFRKRVDTPVRVVIGRPIAPQKLRKYAPDTKALMDFLREQTYSLSPKPLNAVYYGYDFEK